MLPSRTIEIANHLIPTDDRATDDRATDDRGTNSISMTVPVVTTLRSNKFDFIPNDPQCDEQGHQYCLL